MSETIPPVPANDAVQAQPVETLTGDRLCMQCMHPLVGSPITREPQTGLLYVRCGECGTASALFEYPTVGPWLRRMKAVASSTLVALALALLLVLGGISFGFVTGATESASEAAGGVLLERYRALGGVVDEQTWNGSMWGSADMKWVESQEGQAELARARWSLAPLLMLVGLNAIGAMVLAPFAAMLGIAIMRRTPLERALVCALLVGAAAIIAVLLNGAFNMTVTTPSWRSLAESHHGVAYAIFSGVLLASASSLTAAVAPALAAALARFILPPADRRLLSWLWEWRGKPIPRD
ncbi:MAG: hypothetical protein RLY21_2698 [Planctomycetota bacterium]|jgi:hypothetical protein